MHRRRGGTWPTGMARAKRGALGVGEQGSRATGGARKGI